MIAELRSGRLAGAPATDFVLLLQEAARRSADVPPTDSVPGQARWAGRAGGGRRENIVRVARSLGLHLVYVPSMRSGRVQRWPYAEDRGVAIVSTRPLLEPVAVELPAGIQRRVSLIARVDVGAAAPIRIASAHLDNGSFAHPLGSLGPVREREARGLAAALPRRGALLLGGDLNTWFRGPHEAAYRILHRALPRPTVPDDHWTAQRLGIGRKLDYLLFRPSDGWRLLSEPRTAASYGSDHRVVYAWLSPPPAQLPAGPRGAGIEP